jgi:hypothetical protein
MVDHAFQIVAVLGRPCPTLFIQIEKYFILPRLPTFTLPPVRRGYRW